MAADKDEQKTSDSPLNRVRKTERKAGQPTGEVAVRRPQSHATYLNRKKTLQTIFLTIFRIYFEKMPMLGQSAIVEGAL